MPAFRGQSMAVLKDVSNTEKAGIGVENLKHGLIPRITLASVESLTLPLVSPSTYQIICFFYCCLRFLDS